VQRLGQVPLGDKHVADLVVRDREVALPAGIGRVGFGDVLYDRQTVAVERECLGQKIIPGQPESGDHAVADACGLGDRAAADRALPVSHIAAGDTAVAWSPETRLKNLPGSVQQIICFARMLRVPRS
jgi:hypothetical protein